jgi:chromosome partitioning protein
MIVVVGGIKGGSGKTTLATNLAVLRSMEGSKVLLVDADEQLSASDWAQQRDELGVETSWSTIQLAGKSIHAQLSRMGADYDDVIIDVGGRDTTSQRSALAIADMFLIPFKPRSLDIWTIGPVKKMISEIKAINPALVCLAVINQADARGADNEDASEVLRECPDIECLPMSIGHRKAFGNAAAEGLGVVELEKQDKKANEEIRRLYEHLFVKCFISRT